MYWAGCYCKQDCLSPEKALFNKKYSEVTGETQSIKAWACAFLEERSHDQLFQPKLWKPNSADRRSTWPNGYIWIYHLQEVWFASPPLFFRFAYEFGCHRSHSWSTNRSIDITAKVMFYCSHFANLISCSLWNFSLSNSIFPSCFASLVHGNLM